MNIPDKKQMVVEKSKRMTIPVPVHIRSKRPTYKIIDDVEKPFTHKEWKTVMELDGRLQDYMDRSKSNNMKVKIKM